MTAIIIVKLSNYYIICSDKQESGDVLDYNYILLDETKQIDGKTYYPIDNNKRDIGLSNSCKIFSLGRNIVFSGAGSLEDLSQIQFFISQNINKPDLISLIDQTNTLPKSDCSFIIIDKRDMKLHFFKNGAYEEFTDQVLIFGDYRIQVQSFQEVIGLTLNKSYPKEYLKDQIAFVLHEISRQVYYKTISSPFCSSADLWEVKKSVIHKYKLKNYFRWEHD